MKNRIRRILAGALAAAALTFGAIAPAAPAAAHSPGSFYAWEIWPDNTTIRYGYNTGYPTNTDWANRPHQARDQWNAAGSTNEPQHIASLTNWINYGPDYDSCFVGLDRLILYYSDLDFAGTNILGVADTCVSGGEILSANIRMDSSRSNWYAGNGVVPAGKNDVWGVLAHEWGHTLGWLGHIPEGDGACPETSSRSTMCPTTATGNDWWRILYTHDIHTHDQAY